MQLRLKRNNSNRLLISKISIKLILFIAVFSIAIVLLDKIEVSAPDKLIKKEISNDKIITLK